MAYYASISDLIKSVEDMQLSYRKLHSYATIQSGENGEYIKIPFDSITKKYMDFLSKSAIPATFNDTEISTYRYKPKRLSLDLYGTTELWHALLELNNIYSVVEFTLEKQIMVFEPKTVKKLLNEVMILEDLVD